jgi:hypothetical protein
MADPLAAFVPLPFHHVLFPYGFPVHIKATDPAVIRASELCWGGTKARFRENPIELRFLITEGSTRRRQPAIPQFRAQSNLLVMVADRNNFACCDLSSGLGSAFLSKAAVTHASYFRFHFLEAMAYTLLDTRHLVTVHAACLEYEGRGFLLVGDSGAGKSTLAYACARRGWTYLTDDASALVRRRKSRVVLGNPRTFRFRPSISTLFPEFSGPARLRNGKPTIEVTVENLGTIRTAHECEIDFVLFLNRANSGVSDPYVERILPENALPRLFQQVWPPELPIHQERLETVENLLDAQLYNFFYEDLDQAIDLLQQLSRRGIPA